MCMRYRSNSLANQLYRSINKCIIATICAQQLGMRWLCQHNSSMIGVCKKNQAGIWSKNEALTAADLYKSFKKSRYSNRTVSNSNITVTKPFLLSQKGKILWYKARPSWFTVYRQGYLKIICRREVTFHIS